jgi:glyoxylase-like metal-dependent hydrolase (beta-lactamase superfamily II)
MPSIPIRQVPGVYHRRLGDILVTGLADGYLSMPLEALQNITGPDAASLLAREARICPPRVSINVFALRWPGHTVLIDCGGGDLYGAAGGHLQDNLAHAGIAPADVATVLLTHIHPDHSSGLTDRATGARLFPNAEVVVHAAELKHWFDDAEMARAEERPRLRFFQEGRFQITAYMQNHLRTIDRETEVLPGVVAIPSPGHTPGHSAFLVSSGGNTMIVWGDTVHIPEVQIARPQVTVMFDVDQPLAAASRRRILERCVSESLLIGGMHVHFPGFAHLRHEHGRFELTAEQWAFDV